MIDNILRNIIGNETGGYDVAILMSGGTDSCTLLFTSIKTRKESTLLYIQTIWRKIHTTQQKQKKYVIYLMFL